MSRILLIVKYNATSILRNCKEFCIINIKMCSSIKSFSTSVLFLTLILKIFYVITYTFMMLEIDDVTNDCTEHSFIDISLR